MKLNKDFSTDFFGEEPDVKLMSRVTPSEGLSKDLCRLGAMIWASTCMESELKRPLTEIEVRLEEKLGKRIRLTDEFQKGLGFVCGTYEIQPWKLLSGVMGSVASGQYGPGMFRAGLEGDGAAAVLFSFFLDVEEEQTLMIACLREVIPIPVFFQIVVQGMLKHGF